MAFLKIFALAALTLLIGIYGFNFGLWMWRRRDRLGAVGGWILTAVSTGGSLAYLLVKLFS